MSRHTFWIGVCAAVALAGAVYAETVMDDRDFSGGAGTVAAPYQISTPQQLQRMQSAPSAHYVLANDIDASETSTWNGGKGFNPVGNPAQPFTGSFDGRGHTISGLRIDRFGHVTTHIALFGLTGEGAVIRNVYVRKAFVKGCDCVGILVGVNQGTIVNCYASGEVYGGGTFGGLVGGNDRKGRISHCAAAVNVGPTGSGNHLGGLAGSNNGGVISDCFATGTVTGQENPGGLVGVNAGDIRRCYASGNVASSFGGASDSYRRGAGGLVGQNGDGGTIIDCFATGKVSGPDGLFVGGFLGFNDSKATVVNSYCFQRDRSARLSGIGRIFPGAGPAACEDVAEISEAFFKPGTGPLASWRTNQTWRWNSDNGGAARPLFASSYTTGRTGEQSNVVSAPRTVRVELKDGSHLMGSPSVTDLGFVSELGKLQVPISVVERITFNSDNETATLEMNNGDHLSGSVALTSFDLLAVWGQVSIPVQQMRLLAVQGGLFAGNTPFDANGDVSK